ncbi:hypothetical protein [Mesorhizobium sp.]|uniref:hypothetical protein n=1 Tax=Mesorhizobium sp. TaxID=1871066 RepID=UPI000FEA1C4E|nr:hypothetical protein [Mesorhizobium sp.]RWF63419.1 MAG: hypothetical protein EOS47_19250 [Mesorhizobium sp.]
MSNLVEVRNLRIEATTDAGRLVEIIKGVSLDIADGERRRRRAGAEQLGGKRQRTKQAHGLPASRPMRK